MRIALFTDTYHPQINGVVSFLDTIIPKLCVSNEVILFAPGEKEKITVQKMNKRFKIYWVPASPFPYYEGYRMSKVALRSISKIMKKEKPDVVHAHAPTLLGLQGIMVAKKRNVPTVATYHTHFPDYLPYLLDGKLPKVFDSISHKTVRGLIRFVYSLVDIPTAPTAELVKELKNYGVKNPIRLINAVDLQSMKSSTKLDAEFMNRYGIAKNKKIILFVGRVGFEKKLGVLLDSVKKLKSRNWILVIAGSGPQLENYRQQAETLGLKNVIFTGFLEDRLLGAAYSQADLFVSPSDSETFGLTFIEAMAYGKPVIGVNKLGPKELITNGSDGFLIKAGSSNILAKKIDELLGSPSLRKKMGEQAKITAKKYSATECMRETMEIYDSLIRKKKD
jgi:1,2-diacylglycerol 3-alpha-glucosyltransferase